MRRRKPAAAGLEVGVLGAEGGGDGEDQKREEERASERVILSAAKEP